MATRKKKDNVIQMPGTLGGAKVILPENVPSGGWPVINQGTHLTVKTFEDGTTELVWDDEQLLKEVQEAIASVNSTKPKASRKKKDVEV